MPLPDYIDNSQYKLEAVLNPLIANRNQIIQEVINLYAS